MHSGGRKTSHCRASLKVDESALTGESLSVEKSLDEVPEGAALGDQTNRVFSGSFATYGRATCEVTAIGMETEDRQDCEAFEDDIRETYTASDQS